jgi:hypothetical protein
MATRQSGVRSASRVVRAARYQADVLECGSSLLIVRKLAAHFCVSKNKKSKDFAGNKHRHGEEFEKESHLSAQRLSTIYFFNQRMPKELWIDPAVNSNSMCQICVVDSNKSITYRERDDFFNIIEEREWIRSQVRLHNPYKIYIIKTPGSSCIWVKQILSKYNPHLSDWRDCPSNIKKRMTKN